MTDGLSDVDRKASLPMLFQTGWEQVDGRDAIAKTFAFKNFIEAFGWMTKVSFWCEKLNHHPEWCNVYRTVQVTLITHDVDGLSSLDIKLAKKMDALQ